MKKALYKTASESVTIKTEVVCPNDTNPMGILQGGRLVEWMDIAAAVCAQTHADRICVTASINEVAFKAAAYSGDIITIRATITRAFNSSMEILVEAHARKVLKAKKYLISKAYFTFVALDKKGKVTNVISMKPVTEAEKEAYAGALERRENAASRKSSTKPVLA